MDGQNPTALSTTLIRKLRTHALILEERLSILFQEPMPLPALTDEDWQQQRQRYLSRNHLLNAEFAHFRKYGGESITIPTGSDPSDV